MQAPILNVDEWEAALDNCSNMERPQMYRLLICLIRDCGLRPLELAGMQRTWISSSEIRIPIGWSKGGAGRTVPITTAIHSALVAYLRTHNHSFVFLNQRNIPFDNRGMSKCIARMLKRNVGTGSAYSGRRGFARNLNRAGVDPFTICRLMGHSNVLTTMHYIPVTLDDMREAQSLVAA